MKLSNINNKISFCSGYTSQIKSAEKNIVPKKVEQYFKKSSLKDFGTFYNINLKDNKAIALGNYLCAKIFEGLRKLYDFREGYSIQNLIYPQDIYVFDESEGSLFGHQDFFVNISNIRPDKSKPVFDTGTVFINNRLKSLESINDNLDILKKDKIISSNHFLYNFVHEWMHAIFTNLTKHRADMGFYNYERTMQNYQRQTLNDKEKEIVCDVVSCYPITQEIGQYSETFAESWTKFICESLSKDCTSFIKNPVEILKSTPKEFQEILRKVTDIKMLHLKDK